MMAILEFINPFFIFLLTLIPVIFDIKAGTGRGMKSITSSGKFLIVIGIASVGISVYSARNQKIEEKEDRIIQETITKTVERILDETLKEQSYTSYRLKQINTLEEKIDSVKYDTYLSLSKLSETSGNLAEFNEKIDRQLVLENYKMIENSPEVIIDDPIQWEQFDSLSNSYRLIFKFINYGKRTAKNTSIRFIFFLGDSLGMITRHLIIPTFVDGLSVQPFEQIQRIWTYSQGGISFSRNIFEIPHSAYLYIKISYYDQVQNKQLKENLYFDWRGYNKSKLNFHPSIFPLKKKVEEYMETHELNL